MAVNTTTLGAGYIQLPTGTTAERSGSPTVGMIRYNTTIGATEAYGSTGWITMDNLFSAVGGTETTYTVSATNYKSHTFTTSGTFTIQSGSKACDILVVAGGGQGGPWHAGGSGAGGMIVLTNQTLAQGAYTIGIGAGGFTTASDYGAQGAVTTGFGETAYGGGAGRSFPNQGQQFDGGSGGGGAGIGGSPGGTSTGSSSPRGGTIYGNAGGGGRAGPSYHEGGGGGGSGGVGETYVDGVRGGNGGPGVNNAYRYGSNVVYAGGGGGGAWNVAVGGSGGSGVGGGGFANFNNQTQTGSPAVQFTGSGSGGRGGQYPATSIPGPSGADGILVIRYVN